LLNSDANARFVKMADQACHLGGSLASESYLRGDKIIEVAKLTGANAIHPGYGFLSENAEFAEKVSQAGIIFIGPTPESIRILGDKVNYSMTALIERLMVLDQRKAIFS
jgi:acetyl/propionyl-CoA carboxylase alpha subunit